MPVTNEQLLLEVEELLRLMPSSDAIKFETPDNFAWLGRLGAVLRAWNSGRSIPLDGYVLNTRSQRSSTAHSQILLLLQEARHDLRMKTSGPLSAVMGPGNVFDYFDQIRKTIEAAKQDLFFVDPYLDAEFVSRYLGHVSAGVTIRLLAREKLASLLPAVEMFAGQSGAKLEVRSAGGFTTATSS